MDDAAARPAEMVQPLTALEAAWARTDALLAGEVGAARASERPIHLRHPFVFYLGHLPAFSWAIVRFRVASAPPIRADWDVMFSRGIDPDVEDPAVCHAHPAPPAEWPAWEAVVAYRDKVRLAVRRLVEEARLWPADIRLIVEHDLMHLETLYYMLVQSPWKDTSVPCAAVTEGGKPAAQSRWLRVPEGTASVGRARPANAEAWSCFGWDNEFGVAVTTVPEFWIASLPVTVWEYAAFVNDGGYEHSELWTDADWLWVQREQVRHPASWRRIPQRSEWAVLTVDGPEPISLSSSARSWPVSVSLAEARAYASWKHTRLPTESEWDRAAFGDTRGPWGSGGPEGGVHGNFGFTTRRPVPVGGYPAGASWCGVQDMFGNGWEVVDTVFGPLEGFVAMENYAEYSTDFFDGKHYVLKGASWATDPCLVRRSFRNFYQALYPFVFSKFRLVRDELQFKTQDS